MRYLEQGNQNIVVEITEESTKFQFLETITEGYVELEQELPFEVDGSEYVFLPACCYDGNRFEVLKKDYPPLFTPEEARINMPVTITDVPCLEKDGSGKIEVTTGDLGVPCIGIFSKTHKKAVLLFTIQQIDGINLGIAYEKGSIQITYPHMRKEEMYVWPHMKKSTDKGICFLEGKEIQLPYRFFEFSCQNLKEFYHTFFLNRKCMGLDAVLPETLNVKKQFEIQKNKMNLWNWKEKGGFYGIETSPTGNTVWQPGWVGGGMLTYPLMKLGGVLEWERGLSNLDHIFRGQAPSGLLYEYHVTHGFDVIKEFLQGTVGAFVQNVFRVINNRGNIVIIELPFLD